MGDVKKWSVTYTKHVKQKRKVYQDGFLELHSSRSKVILYDDCEKLLDSRFVKKDDTIASGEMLAFDSYLVDIGDLQGDQKPILKVYDCPQDTKSNRTCEAFHSPKFERKLNLGQRKVRSSNLSPSQKVIREFKKSEVTKYGSSPSCPETTKTSKIEWQVLYTTQVTQKAKKYHDGSLQFLICGSQREQVVLYDENRRLLESRFLKKDETIKSGESIAFNGHLVDIGECQEDYKRLMDSKVQERNFNMVGKREAGRGQIHFHNQFPVGEHQKEVVRRKHMNSNSQTSIHENNLSALGINKKPVRAAHEILSILRKTKTEMDVATMESFSMEGFHASQSSNFLQSDTRGQKKEQLQDVCDEGSSIVDLNEENTRIHKDSSEVPKYEAVDEVLLVEIARSAKKGSETASSFFVGSGATNIFEHMVDIDLPESSDTSRCSSSGSKGLATLELDSKVSIDSVLQDISTGDLERGNCTELVSCKENRTGETPAAAFGSDTCEPIVAVEPGNVPQPCADIQDLDARWRNGVHIIGIATSSDCTSHEVSVDKNISEQDTSTKKTDEFPNFDLGF